MKIKNKRLLATAEKFTNLMIKRIMEISDDWEQPWLTVKRKDFLPRNFSGRYYSGGNTFMLLLSSLTKDYRTPVFLTFKQAEKIGVRILKGSVSFPVYHITYMYYNYNTKELISISEYEKLNEMDKVSYSLIPTPKCYDVFNLDQTNYNEVYPDEWNELQAKHYIEPKFNAEEMYNHPLLDEIIYNCRWVCPIQIQLSNRAYYSAGNDRIILPFKTQFESGESFYGTALHEMTHSTGHKDRLNRLKCGDENYAREELVAELSAALMAFYLGIETCIRKDHITYLKGWLEELHKDSTFLMDVLTDVVQAVKYMCLHINFNPFDEENLHEPISVSDSKHPVSRIPVQENELVVVN
ncbi:ArdC family protein [Dysgonomonas sp. 25]|uniref:ArdC family protein n=1 Tax=Dysgonomonas sp. 25 TaxID=2302933 RepID=UPI0013D6AE45|nr:zincin-like metallopeptidase domain-containing protein [Dysgonomonas sp. 25]